MTPPISTYSIQPVVTPPKTAFRARPAPSPQLCLPRHVAVAMDVSRYDDALQFGGALAELLQICLEQDVEWLSLFVPEALAQDVNFAAVLENFIRAQAEPLALSGMRFVAPANSEKTSSVFTKAIQAAAARPVENVLLNVSISVNDGRVELLEAIKMLAAEAAAGRMLPESIDAKAIERGLALNGLPPVDLLIRTGGEQSLSSFLLWHAAYAELLFLDAPFARLRRQNLKAALSDYARRRRTFGALPK